MNAELTLVKTTFNHCFITDNLRLSHKMSGMPKGKSQQCLDHE